MIGFNGTVLTKPPLPLFDGESGLLDDLCRCGGVHVEALTNAQGGIAAQVQDGDVVLPPHRQSAHQHPVELQDTPGAVCTASGKIGAWPP